MLHAYKTFDNDNDIIDNDTQKRKLTWITINHKAYSSIFTNIVVKRHDYANYGWMLYMGIKYNSSDFLPRTYEYRLFNIL